MKLMKNKKLIKSFFTVILIFILNSCINKTEVDLIVHNSRIYTIDDNNSIFEAIAIKNKKIIALGKNNQILNKYKTKSKIDGGGKFIYPGLIDAHCHFLYYGLQLEMVNLSSANSFNEIIDLLTKRKDQNKTNWLIGYGWDQNQWKDKKWPNNELLSKYFKNTNVVLSRIDGHALMANKKAISTSKIPMDTSVKGGYIEKIEDKYTGLFIDNAMDLILNNIPEPTQENKKTALLKAQQKCISLGLTTVDIAGLDKSDIDLIDKLHKTDELKIKVYAMLSDNQENFNYFIDSIGEPIKTQKLNIRSFKFFADGSIGSRGACLINPYNDLETSKGFMLQEEKIFNIKLEKLKENGFQACTHAIGDSANRVILNSYANVLKNNNDLRWRIEHAQCVTSKDLIYFKKYNIIPSVQPTHATSDFIWAILRLGKERLMNCYQYYSLFKENQLIALGTDFPVEKINPIYTFYSAVFRKNIEGKPIGGFQKNEALSRHEAIKGMTIWAALANFEENEKGSLEIGKYADLIILNKDLFQANESEILNTKVIRTIIDGDVVYKD